MQLHATILDIRQRRMVAATVHIENGKIAAITDPVEPPNGYLLPGFVDAHVHVESSMLTPAAFAREAVRHGTVATVSDPHEIANVLGVPGVDFMLDNAAQVPFKFHFGAPSCVPATPFETAGAIIGPAEVEALLQRPDIWYLSEMMNFPGVLHADPDVMAKIAAAHRIGKPVDGHAPALRGAALERYITAGITTDHEAFTYEEGLEKLQRGMKILIREGSAAKNFEALIGLLPQFPDSIMFCSDDKHPDDLLRGHINQLVARALAKGLDLFDVLQAACLNPVEHYHLPVGTLQVGDAADFIWVQNLDFEQIGQTWIDGELVAENGQSRIEYTPSATPNQFGIGPLEVSAFHLHARTGRVRTILAEDGAIVTGSMEANVLVESDNAVSDLAHDVLKIAVVNRYHPAPVALGFVHGFGLRTGALASSVAHDCHNIVVVGCTDADMCRAANLVIEAKGGISAVGEGSERVLALPVAGIMSNQDGATVSEAYSGIDQLVKDNLGSTLSAPFMTLSFMALPVIPSLKMSDKGLFDGVAFGFTEVFV
jgi:adenine deaminase